jgi:murein DD-endopeptidase MepM/ murein hydrolase activator NlpD
MIQAPTNHIIGEFLKLQHFGSYAAHLIEEQRKKVVETYSAENMIKTGFFANLDKFPDPTSIDFNFNYNSTPKFHVFPEKIIVTLTSKFGPRGGRNHNGIDLQGTDSTGSTEVPVIAPRDCVIYETGTAKNNPGNGNYLRLQFKVGNDTYQMSYLHLAEEVKIHGPVTAGTIIGKQGSTGYSTGPHLHLEIKINGRLVDPISYVFYNRIYLV